MDYEKKYKEALGWMQSLYNGLHEKTKEEAERYFPELKESEDEKIRKELIIYLYNELNNITQLTPRTNEFERWIAWLKKQGQTYTKKDVDDAYLNGISDAKNEIEKQYEVPVTINIDKMVEDYANNEECDNDGFGKPVNCMIRAYRQGLTDAIVILNLRKQGEPKESIVLKFREGDVIEYKSKQWTIIGVDLDNHCYDLSNDECVDFDTAHYAFKLVEKKPTECSSKWDISDFRTWQYIVSDVLTKKDGIGQYIDSGECKKIAKYMQEEWSKKLSIEQKPNNNQFTPEQASVLDSHIDKLIEQKPAWTEEDEAMFAEIADLLWEGYKQSDSKFSWDDIRNWVNPKLKSLKERVQPQSTWKPSEEQIYSLKEATNIVGSKYKSCLNSLYSDLKKLMEE